MNTIPVYKSIHAYARGRFRIIDNENNLFVFPGINTEDSQDDNLSAAGVPETIFRLLKRLETKVDHLLVIAQEKNLATDFPCLLQAFQIGGNGILFRSDTHLAAGMKLEIVLFLSGMPLRIAGGIGRLDSQENTVHGALWKLSFTRLRENDLDVIMQFVFQEERQKIRELKSS